MKSLKLLLLVLSLSSFERVHGQLTIVNQDYAKALNIAQKENKLLFIDFYTTWCGPCKVLDKTIFRNDSLGEILGKNVVLLQYDAEKDTVFHLTKKYHIFIYPSAVILNKDGYVVDRNYGFPGNDFSTLCKSVLDFTNKSVERNNQNIIIKGYSNKIDLSAYPKFYVDYVGNAKARKPSREIIKSYFSENHDIFSEEYFSTLIYFSVSDKADIIVKNKKKYIDLYGELETTALLFMIARDKFDNAISENSQQKFDEAVSFYIESVDDKESETTLQNFKIEFLKSQNKWTEVLTILEDRKSKGELSDEAINNYSWEAYKKCDDQQVIGRYIQWMKELTNRKPQYTYLDTYAFLTYKSGNKALTKEIVNLAIEAAKKEKKSVKDLEELLKRVS